MLTSLVALIAAGGITFLITPLVRRLAQRLDIIDKPDRIRKRHRRLVPLWGGLSIAIALFISISCCALWLPDIQLILNYRDSFLLSRLPWIGLAYLIILVFGLVDDKHPLPPKVKLLVQFIAVFIVVLAGIYIKSIKLPWADESIHLWPLLGMLVTFLWMLFMINAFNFIDGVDGLAVSQAVISGVGLTIGGILIAHQSQSLLANYQSQLGVLIASAVAGAALGFYRYNRFPAKLFLGDAGSTLLGFSLCLSGFLIISQSTTATAPLAVVMILGWPIIDTLQVIIRRLSKGVPMSKADNRHLHHELQKKGFTKTATVAFINVVSIILVIVGIGIIWL